jgi:transcription antitermination factor NusG
MIHHNNANHSWYALQVKPKFERVVGTILEGKSLETFYPTYKKRRIWSDRIKETEAPLFPGYIFCRFNVHDRLPVLTTPGVMRVVGVGRIPAEIAEAEISAVKRIVLSGIPAMPWPFPRVGQPVVIQKGPLEGTEGVLVAVRNRYRLVVSIGLLQRSVSAEVDAEWVCVTQSPFRRPQAVPCSSM